MTGAPDKARKKEIARAWTDRKRMQGVFALRCVPTGQVWVSTSRNLDSQRNGVWFSLRTGGHPNRAAQEAWNTHGEEGFAYEIVEQVSDEGLTPLGFADLLKTRDRYWREILGATALVG